MKLKTQEQLLLELEDLRARLDEAEDTLRAIRSGEVDALIASCDRASLISALCDYGNNPHAKALVDQLVGRARQTGQAPGCSTRGASVTPAARRDDQVKVYGNKFALTIEASNTPKRDMPTVSIEAAAALPGNGQSFAWHQKLTFQLTSDELPVAAAVLLGLLPRLEFRNHPSENGGVKALVMEDQGARLFVKLSETGGRVCAVPVDGGRLPYLTALVLRQFATSMRVTPGEAVEILKLTTARLIARSVPQDAPPAKAS